MDIFPNEVVTETEAVQVRSNEQVLHLSAHATIGKEVPSCLQLHGWLQGHEVLILVDSGSSASFVSKNLQPGTPNSKNSLGVCTYLGLA